MRVLISNDDGVFSPGIAALAKALMPLGDVTVCAPQNEQSAVSRALTMTRPLRLEPVKVAGVECPCWAVDGTPTDCVKLAISRLFDAPPDIVVSGINIGANLGSDVLFSGTVAAAMEGAMQGVPAVAVSLAVSESMDFERAAGYAAKAVRAALRTTFARGTVMNVNVPARPVQGWKLTSLGVLEYGENYEQRQDPRGRNYYWLTGNKQPAAAHSDADDAWVEKGYITVTPIKCDLTDYDLLQQWSLLEDLR